MGRRHGATIAALATTLGVALGSPLGGIAASGVRIDQRVQAALARSEEVAVIVVFREELPLDAPDGQRQESVDRIQESVLATLDQSDFRLQRRFEYVAAVAGTIGRRGLETLRHNRMVEAIEPDVVHLPALAQAVPILGADVVHDVHGLTGAGVSVAVLDTGIDPKHPDLADSIVGQHCFSSNGGCRPNNSTESDDAQDENGHGTGVAGIITADGEVSPPGVAPGAGIVAVRVFDDKARAQTSDIIAGLEWVRRNRRELGVKVVNMSLGSQEVYSGNCDSSDQARARLIGQLNALGIAIFAASGNNGATNGLSAPACLSGVISVGATYDARLGRQPARGVWEAGCYDEFTSPEIITCFSNVARTLSLVAPGAMIRHPKLGGGVAETGGTSDASPMAAGVAALLYELDPGLEPRALERLLQQTGVPLDHPRLNMSFRRVNALRAVQTLKGITPQPPTATAPGTSTGMPTAITATATSDAATMPPPATEATPTVDPVATPTATAIVWPTDSPATATAIVWPTDAATPWGKPFRILLPLVCRSR